MSLEKRAALGRIATELHRLEREAEAVGEEFLAYVVQMARIEAETAGQEEPIGRSAGAVH